MPGASCGRRMAALPSEQRCEHPLGWRRNADGWLDVQFGHVEPLVLASPVARLVVRSGRLGPLGGKASDRARVEKAAAWDLESGSPARGRGRRHAGSRRGQSWRDHLPRPRPSAYPRGRSFYGCHQMIGDVGVDGERVPAVPGIRVVPVSGVLGDPLGRGYRVLRGGSGHLAYRGPQHVPNWDLPSAVRSSPVCCARDA